MSSLIREKIYRGLFTIPMSTSLLGYNVTQVKLMFLLSNNLSNKPIFFALLLLLEKLTLSTFTFVFTRKSIANFNIKKKLKFGAVFTMTELQKDQFLRIFMSYSLQKLDPSIFFHSRDFIRYSFTKESLSFGLQKVLFNLLISLNSRDYELFAPLFESMVYGVHIYFYTNFRNFFMNRLLLSQYNILIS